EPVGRDDPVDGVLKGGRREAGEQVVRDVVREIAQLHHVDGRLDPALTQFGHGGRRQAVGEHAGRRGVREPCAHHGDATGHDTVSFRVAATPKAEPRGSSVATLAGVSWYGPPTVRLLPPAEVGRAWRVGPSP